MTEKQQAYLNDLLKTAMAAMDKMVETDGAQRGDGEMVFPKVKMRCAKRGFVLNYSAVRSGMQAWLANNIPAEPKSIDRLRDWSWVREFVNSIDDTSIYLVPDEDE